MQHSERGGAELALLRIVKVNNYYYSLKVSGEPATAEPPSHLGGAEILQARGKFFFQRSVGSTAQWALWSGR